MNPPQRCRRAGVKGKNEHCSNEGWILMDLFCKIAKNKQIITTKRAVWVFHFALCQRFYDCKIVGEPIWFQFVKEIKKPFHLTAPNNSLGSVKPRRSTTQRQFVKYYLNVMFWMCCSIKAANVQQIQIISADYMQTNMVRYECAQVVQAVWVGCR